MAARLQHVHCYGRRWQQQLATQTITVEDTTAPEFTAFLPTRWNARRDTYGGRDCVDNCSDVSITVESETTAGDAAGNYTIVRTFTATDACSSNKSQTMG